jgi:hypothetical protein
MFSDDVFEAMCKAQEDFYLGGWDDLTDQLKKRRIDSMRDAMTVAEGELVKLLKRAAGPAAEAAIQSYHRGNLFDKSRELALDALLRSLELKP